ncbi:MAG TPA: GntR family transcriptional regulator [Acidimicrobiia bacterium]|nr:GntR family transcriptional regulator [Acidimicrobiia bacterium]
MSRSVHDNTRLRSDAVASRIGRMIESGEYPPGSQLPPERELAETLDVSRTAVREAFMALTAVGLVEAHVGRGRFVVKEARERRSHFLAGQLFELHRSDLAELSVVRELLEVAAVREIPFASMPAVGAKMRLVLDEARRALEDRDLERLARLDSEFHSIPIEHCPNRPLRILTAGVVLAMGEFVREVLSDPTWDEMSLDQHEHIVESFKSKDQELAAILIGRHQSAAIRRVAEAKADQLEQMAGG